VERATVLIADDEPRFRALLRETVNTDRRLIVVGEAADGERAVELALRLKPQVVLLDLDMPVHGGLAATRALATALPHAAIIIVSGNTDTTATDQVLAAGATTLLPKAKLDTVARLILDALACATAATASDDRAAMRGQPHAGATPGSAPR
jgi:DNA-binding NarL/FixJ family response regulator